MNLKTEKSGNPFQTVWRILSIPLSVIGLLSLSDSIVTLNKNLVGIIRSYQSIVYPIYRFCFAWFPIALPHWIFDYITLGLFYASCQRKVYGVIVGERKIWKAIFNSLWAYFLLIIFWPYFFIDSVRMVLWTDSEGIITSLTKQPHPIWVKYNFRNKDILVFQYLAASFLIFILILIINYAILLKH